jgi:hypothetical protein
MFIPPPFQKKEAQVLNRKNYRLRLELFLKINFWQIKIAFLKPEKVLITTNFFNDCFNNRILI